MPSYAPPKPPPKRRPQAKTLNPEWLERRSDALKTVTDLLTLQQDELLRSYLIAARAELYVLKNIKTNRAYQLGFAKVQRLVLLGLGLTRER